MTQTALELTTPINRTVDSIRLSTNKNLNQSMRGKLGQFMSSMAVSELLASMFESFEGEIKLLDAGAGVGSLTAAFVQRATTNGAKSIASYCYEISDTMIQGLSETLEICKQNATDLMIDWSDQIIDADFIEDSVKQLSDDNYIEKYNKAILNPPYLKISAKGKERTLLREVGIETGNLYSAFVALAIKQLKNGGELVAITPRSFCNGPYFNEYRSLMLSECSLNKIHVFNCRKSAFKSDKVLQENVIFHLTKGEPQRKNVIIYSSSCAEDQNPTEIEIPFSEIVKPNNPDKFIHIVTNTEEREISNRAGGLPCSLSDLNIQVSTGKVVDFRTRENLSQEFVEGSVPLLFPQHLQNCEVKWPITGAKKPNALMSNEKTANLMVPNGTYVLTRRLTAKEEKRRIAASIYTPNIANVDVVGFENKTNYFHANGVSLDTETAKGLWVFLNSTLIDKYFRQLNGHTQVNATDLRVLRYPTKSQLKEIGKSATSTNFNQEEVDSIVDKII